MFNLKPKEDIFFTLLVNAAKNAHKATQELHNLFLNYSDSINIINKISKLETDGDLIKHEIETKLRDSFITPFDREDIFMIIKTLDKFVNNIQSSAYRFQMLHIDTIEPSTLEISTRLVKLSEQLIILMENLNSKKNIESVNNAIFKINVLESEIDKVFKRTITELFDNPQDILKVVKWKEIYQHLENTADQCEEIANSIAGVVTKNE